MLTLPRGEISATAERCGWTRDHGCESLLRTAAPNGTSTMVLDRDEIRIVVRFRYAKVVSGMIYDLPQVSRRTARAKVRMIDHTDDFRSADDRLARVLTWMGGYDR